MATAPRAKIMKKSGRKECAERARTGTRKLKALSYIFEERDRMVRRGEFEIMGRLMMLRMERGDIDFFKGGSYVGRLTDGSFVLLNEWKGLPDIIALEADLCDSCRAACTYCEASGERLCMHVGCGGEGRVILTYKACPGPGCKQESEKPRLDCELCHGAGQVPDQVQDCPECKGTKKQKCPKCRGTGKMSTGRKDGAPPSPDDFDSSGLMFEARRCQDCDGTGRKIQRTPQPWREWAIGELEGYAVLGPIVGMLWAADLLRDPRQRPEYCAISPDQKGNLAALLVKAPDATGQPMYLYGGNASLEFLK